MIGRLQGTFLEKKPPKLIIDVGGIGYEVEVSMNTCFDIQDKIEGALFIHTIVKEDEISLYGFLDEVERALFRILIKISGVGPKLALSILSSMSVSAFESAINEKNASSLLKIPGIGQRTAERMLVELKGKFNTSSIAPAIDELMVQDAFDALTSLGYKTNDIKRAIKKVDDIKDLRVEDIIRKSLKELTEIG